MLAKKLFPVAPALMLVAASANAQTVAKPFSASIGYNYLTTGDARDATEAGGITASLGYRLADVLAGKLPVTPTIELGFARNGSGDERLDVFSLQAVGRFSLGTGSNLYGGLGLGIGRTEVRTKTTQIVSGGGSSGGNVTEIVKNTDSKTSIVGKLLVGTSLGKDLFGELAFNFNGSVSGVKADSLSLTVGIRF